MKNNLFKLTLLLSAIIFCLTSLLTSNVEAYKAATFKNEEAVMPVSQPNDGLLPVQDALKNSVFVPSTIPQPPVKPPNLDPVAWQKYYADYVSYIKLLSDASMIASAWKTLLNGLKEMLTAHPKIITGAAIKAVLDEATAFLNSAAFAGLNNTEKADHVSLIIETLKTAVSKNSSIDRATLTNALEAIEKFIGTNGWELGAGFAALDNSQKQRILNSFVALAKEIMNSGSSTIDAGVRFDLAINLSRLLTTSLREQFKNQNYTIDLSQIKKDIVDMILNYVKSDAFRGLNDDQQIAVIWHFNRVAIELAWRPEDNEANKELIGKITDVFRKALEVGSSKVQAMAINELTHLFRISNWRNGEVAIKFLDALNISGGLASLINKLLADVSNASLDPNLRGDIAIALSNLLLHRNDIGKVGIQIEAGVLDQIKTKVTDYIKGLNDGTITAAWEIRNGLLHIAGGAIAGLIDAGEQNATLNKAFIDAYLKMAGDSLILSEAQGGSVHLQTTVINLLTRLRNISTAKGDNSLADKMKGLLLNSGFDINAYIANAKTEMTKLTGINADAGAWFAAGLTNLAQLHLAEGTGKIDVQTLKGIAVSIKSWVTDQKNLDDMRWMWLQEQLFQQLKELTKQIYKKDSTFAGDKELEDVLVDIFSVIPNIKDPLVKKLATKAISEELVKYLKDNNREALAKRLEDIFKGPGR